MSLKKWLDQERGRYTALAVYLNVSVGRISQMATVGVPSKYMLSVRDLTDVVVFLKSMLNESPPVRRAWLTKTNAIGQGI